MHHIFSSPSVSEGELLLSPFICRHSVNNYDGDAISSETTNVRVLKFHKKDPLGVQSLLTEIHVDYHEVIIVVDSVDNMNISRCY